MSPASRAPRTTLSTHPCPAGEEQTERVLAASIWAVHLEMQTQVCLFHVSADCDSHCAENKLKPLILLPRGVLLPYRSLL